MGTKSTKKSSKKGASKKTAAKKKRNKIILFVAEFFVLAILGFVLWFVIKGAETNHIIINEDDPGLINEGSVWDVDDNSTGREELKGYKQVALFGVDSTQGELVKNTRSDTIIIASINLDTKDIKLCSVYRDTYLNLGNDTYSKCNAAYAKGSAEQAIRMLNMNLDLNITDYITVGFKGVVETVDALGGVDIDVNSAEIEHLNNYQYTIAENLNRKADYIPVSSTGLQTLDGLQACGYCRIRYTAGDDFRRTERQRTVLTEMANKCKTINPAKLSEVASGTFPNTSTSFSLNEILEFAVEAPNFNIVGSEGFPFEDFRATGTIGKDGSCVIPTNLETNVSLLHQYFFGVENYEPSSTVKECSETIEVKTKPYL